MSTGCAGVEDLVAGALPGSDEDGGGATGSTYGDLFMARLGKSLPKPAAAVVLSNAVTFGVAKVMERGRAIRGRFGLADVTWACACSIEVQVGAAVVVVELMMLVAGLRGVSGGGGGAGDEVEKGELYGPAAEEAEAEVAAAAVEVADEAAAAVGALRVGTASREDLVVPGMVGDGDAAAAAAAVSAPCGDEDPGRS
jgi:hypothetical protein